MSDELVKRLRAVDHMSLEDCFCQSALYDQAADRIEQLERELSISRMAQVVMGNGAEALTAERDKYEAAWMTAEGKLADVEAERDRLGRELNVAKYGVPDFAWSVHLAAMAEVQAERDRLRKALIELIQQTHNCERELTEDLHHVDFCGESVPLTNAREALKGETP